MLCTSRHAGDGARARVARLRWAVVTAVGAPLAGLAVAGEHPAVRIRVHGFTAIESSGCFGLDLHGPADADNPEEVYKIGGTKVFVSRRHLVPHAYAYSGRITLDECGQIASRAAHRVIGFAWGTAHAAPSGLVHLSRSGGRLSEFEDLLKGVPEEHFGCIVYVAPADGESTPPGSFSCGGAEDLCLRLDFRPALTPAGDPEPAEELCCHQEMDLLFMDSFVSTINGFWIAYRHADQFRADCGSSAGLEKDWAVTHPIQYEVVRWGEAAIFLLVVTFAKGARQLKSTEGTVVKRASWLHVIAYWWVKLWSSLAIGAHVQVKMALMGHLNFRISIMSAVATSILALLLTTLGSGVCYDLPAFVFKMVLLERLRWELLWALIMGILGGIWCDIMQIYVYSPMVVELIGHHPIALGFVSFFGSSTLFVLINAVWFRLLHYKTGVLLVCDKGDTRQHSMEYVPFITDLSEPVAIGLDPSSESVASPAAPWEDVALKA